MNCGSAALSAPSLSKGGVPGASELAGIYCCKKCGFRGVPLEVESVKKFKEHLKKRKKSRGKGKKKKGGKTRKK